LIASSALAVASSGCAGADGTDDGAESDLSNLQASQVTAAAWMGSVSSAKLLSELTIPGTHESCARHEPFAHTAKCQNLSLADQLAAGVRFFDIRGRHYNDSLQIHHDRIFQEMSFDDVLAPVWSFLKAHPSETVIMSVKDEYTPAGNHRTYQQTFDAYVAKHPAGWYLGATVPSLSQVRGKIVLIRRFNSNAPLGIDASPAHWTDDAVFSIGGAAHLRVQDKYAVSNDGTKWSQIQSLFGEALHGDRSTIFINFSSGYHSQLFGIPDIVGVSDAMNADLATYFSAPAQKKGRYGIVAMDFVDAHRADLVFRKNF